QLLAVRCYLRRIIAECGARWMRAAHGVTHFAELVDEIERWRAGSAQPVFYVTFNYDTMLEDVLGPWHDSGFDEMTSYMRPQFSLFKLHGSVDWGRQVPVPLHLTNDPPGVRAFLFERAGNYDVL